MGRVRDVEDGGDDRGLSDEGVLMRTIRQSSDYRLIYHSSETLCTFQASSWTLAALKDGLLHVLIATCM